MNREDLVIELREVSKDLLAFKRARDCIYSRLRELEDDPDRLAMMKDWPAFKAIDNCLIMAIVRCEGLTEDYRKHLESLELPNNVVVLEERHDIAGD